MKKFISLILSLAIVFSLSACGLKNEIVKSKTLPISIGPEPKSIDPAFASTADEATLVIHAFAGLAGYRQNETGEIELFADCAKELVEPIANNDGTYTYVYELKDGLKWSDGSELTADDFVFAWNRAASYGTKSDCAYMLEIIDGYKYVSAVNEKGKLKYPYAQLNVSASEDGKTLTVVTVSKADYWNELLASPAFMPVNAAATGSENWATEPEKYISNGPYTLSKWEHDNTIVFKKNPNYHNAKSITMETIEFNLSNNTKNMLSKFKSNDWLFIEDVPTNEIKKLKRKYSDEFVVNNQLGTYYITFNINKSLLPSDTTLKGRSYQVAQAEIRSAIGLLLDRNYIIKDIAKCNQIPASSIIPAGIMDSSGVAFYKNAGNSKDHIGYWDVSSAAYSSNCAQAVKTLKKYYNYDIKSGKFTNIPTIEYIYTSGVKHDDIAEYIQDVLDEYGITVNLVKQESSTAVNTRKNGEFTTIHNVCVADYNDPLYFLELWVSDSANNDAQFGHGNHKGVPFYSIDLSPYGIDYKVENGTWAQAYDRLIEEIKKCNNTAARFRLMHLAEDLLIQTGAIIPLYYDTDLYLINKDVHGFFTSPLGYRYFMYTNY